MCLWRVACSWQCCVRALGVEKCCAENRHCMHSSMVQCPNMHLSVTDCFLVSSFSMVVVAIVIQFIRPLSMLILSIFNKKHPFAWWWHSFFIISFIGAASGFRLAEAVSSATSSVSQSTTGLRTFQAVTIHSYRRISHQPSPSPSNHGKVSQPNRNQA